MSASNFAVGENGWKNAREKNKSWKMRSGAIWNIIQKPQNTWFYLFLEEALR